MTSRASSLALVAVLAGALASSSGCTRAEGGSLVIEAPARIRQAVTSDDAALCGRLAVDLTFDHVGDGADPLLQNEPLVPVAGEPCSFTLPSSVERTFPRGRYDVLVRFLAGDGAFTGADSCEAQSTGPVWVGAYVLEDLDFPSEALRFPNDSFLSRPADAGRLPVAGVSFDLDGDGRDNLAELAAESDPCVENTPPVVSLTLDAPSGDEEQPVTLRVSSADPAGVRHRLTVRLTHEHGPTAGTEVITYRRFTSAPANESLTPDPDSERFSEPWDLVVEEASEDGGGSLALTLRFVPDEPFTGAIHVTATADDGSGTLLAEAAPALLTITDLADPTSLLFEDEEGALVPVERVDFREVGDGVAPTVRRFQIADEDLGDDVSQWSVELAPGSPDGMTLTQDLSFWSLAWSPDNDDVVSAPAEGHTLYLQFKDPSGAPAGDPQAYPVGVAPLYNDAPSFGDLDGLSLALSSGPFAMKQLAFDFLDPDEATGQPSCALEVLPAGATTCTSAWSETRCEVSGPRAGDTWPFVVTLTPSASYFDDCGATPQFELRLAISDVAPAGADPSDARTVATLESCGAEPGCVEHLQLYTAETVSVSTVTGGPAAPSSTISDLTELRIDGARDVGVLTATDDAIGYTGSAVYVVDLATSPPRFAHQVPRTALCSFYEGFLRVPHAVAVDEVNGRVVGFGHAGSALDDCYNTTTRVVFSLSTEPPYDVVTWPVEEACAAACEYFGCGGAPAADALGNVYLPCGGDTGTLLRVDGANQLSTHDITGYDMDQDAWGTAVVEAPDGKSWFVWPDRAGVLFVDTSTWDDASVDSERLTLPGWFDYWFEQGRADPWRHNYLYAYDEDKDGADLELYRVSFDTGAPVQEGPLVVGDHGTSNSGDRWVRFLLKPVVEGRPAAEPDLILTGQVLSEERLHVDLDAFATVTSRNPEDYWYTREVFESPDPRFTVGWVDSLTAGYEGLKLYPWDPALPFEVQQIPGTTDWAESYMRDWSVSYTAGIATWSDESGVIRVLRFEQAP